MISFYQMTIWEALDPNAKHEPVVSRSVYPDGRDVTTYWCPLCDVPVGSSYDGQCEKLNTCRHGHKIDWSKEDANTSH